MITANTNIELFPIPSHTRDTTSPRVWPEATPATAKVLQEILKDNHKKWHIFLNDTKFHNHTAHHILALWALGADESILKAAYEEDSKHQRPAMASLEALTDANWRTHIGDEQYYQAYLEFFTEKVKTNGVDGLFEEYIFAPSANVVSGEEVQPAMLSRFLGGLLHPMIHTGYGFEFDLTGIVLEGIAQTAVHDDDSENLFPESLFTPDIEGERLAACFAKAVGLETPDETPKGPVHALSVLARILADPRFEAGKPVGQFMIYPGTVAKHGEAIWAYISQWDLDGPIQDKVEEMVWTTVLIYGVGGWEGPQNPFNASFFHMHMVTSSLFLTSLVTHLDRRSQQLLLQTYFAVVLTWYIGHGRAPINIEGFLENVGWKHPTPPGPLPILHKEAVPSPTSPKATTPNTWLATLQSTLMHPDEHVPKLQRALAHYGELYGERQAGYFAGLELKGAEKLDGTLFLRVSGLTAERTGWIGEGKSPEDGTWDTRGFYKPT